MNTSSTVISALLRKGPLVGIGLFICLFVVATLHYPGGSQADTTSPGFDWFHNYYCNLMNSKAINGETNKARPYAIVSVWAISASLALFFINFAENMLKAKCWRDITKWSATLSMVSLSMLFTKYHDVVIVVSSLFGLVTMVGVIYGLYLSSMTFYKWVAAICILLLAANNVIYHTDLGIIYLPFLQKITLLLVLLWVVGLQLCLSHTSADIVSDQK